MTAKELCEQLSQQSERLVNELKYNGTQFTENRLTHLERQVELLQVGLSNTLKMITELEYRNEHQSDYVKAANERS